MPHISYPSSRVEFKFIESGSWEKKGNGKDSLYVTISENGTDYKLDLLGFNKWDTKDNPEEYFSGLKNGILWYRRALTPKGQNFGIGKSSNQNNDQLHLVTVDIPPQFYASDGTLKWKFTKDSDDKQEYSGIDDVRLIAYGIGCDIPADEDVEGDEGVQGESQNWSEGRSFVSIG